MLNSAARFIQRCLLSGSAMTLLGILHRPPTKTFPCDRYRVPKTLPAIICCLRRTHVKAGDSLFAVTSTILWKTSPTDKLHFSNRIDAHSIQPVPWVMKALYSLADLFNPAPFQFLWETPEDYSYTNINHCIVEQCRVNKLVQCLTRQHRIRIGFS